MLESVNTRRFFFVFKGGNMSADFGGKLLWEYDWLVFVTESASVILTQHTRKTVWTRMTSFSMDNNIRKEPRPPLFSQNLIVEAMRSHRALTQHPGYNYIERPENCLYS